LKLSESFGGGGGGPTTMVVTVETSTLLSV